MERKAKLLEAVELLKLEKHRQESDTRKERPLASQAKVKMEHVKIEEDNNQS